MNYLLCQVLIVVGSMLPQDVDPSLMATYARFALWASSDQVEVVFRSKRQAKRVKAEYDHQGRTLDVLFGWRQGG